MAVNLNKLKWLVTGALFALCVGPTFISYTPYIFRWDDADYLERAVAVSRAFWSGNAHGLGAAMVGIRPPIMTLLGIPWGPIQTWDAAGRCFITLAAAISLMAALCLYLLLRIGVKPFLILLGSVCVFASMGPLQRGGSVRYVGTGFMADSLFAWTCLAAVLLIPYEARMHCPSIRGSVVRGVLWGTILSLGAMTKLSFLFFVLAVLPTVFFIRIHYAGLRRALTALLAFVCWSAPSAIYLIRWGGQTFNNAKASSFGQLAALYYHNALWPFLGSSIRNSPSLVLSLVFLVIALMSHLIRRQTTVAWPRLLALVMMIGFGVIVLAAPNRQIRYSFPVIVAVPFLSGVLMSRNEHSIPGRSSALAAGLVLCGLLVAAVPTVYRAGRQSLSRCDAILAYAARNGAKHIILATESPTLNHDLMDLALEISKPKCPLRVDSLAYNAMSGVPIEADYRAMSLSDGVVFQDSKDLSPPFTNQRVPEYEQYVQRGGRLPIRIGEDVSVYSMQGALQLGVGP